ncbi:hypothetical protein SY83_19615 [Paenibacillus swuensis]|uniref:Cytochrome C oxidase assembly protein n=1 Tax=Paenibacillus swuensis TaxID=1178515 RepID=A0A172TM27_9BACL|nr:cytochrome c oxidase assembly protein [Paenibacillus swuensis]ANE48129.1 hypothetical protein SY83_19615 [Paenibacillus swuensis]
MDPVMIHTHHAGSHVSVIWIGFVLGTVIISYLVAVTLSKQRYRRTWPLYRSLCWLAGMICIAVALFNHTSTDFNTHMFGHLFLGMLAPIFIAMSLPLTLLLRSLPVRHARRLTGWLSLKLPRVLCHPVFTAILNIGGLWLLYTTELYSFMQHHFYAHVLVHLHVFLAGYLFTVSILRAESMLHRTSFITRTIVFGLAWAGHGILSKYIYAHPPEGVPWAEAESGAMLMYYGGDVIEALLLILFFAGWYRSARTERLTLPKPYYSEPKL